MFSDLMNSYDIDYNHVPEITEFKSMFFLPNIIFIYLKNKSPLK